MALDFRLAASSFAVFFTIVSSAFASGQAPSSLSLFLSPNPVYLGEAATLTATVSPAGTTGKVTFYDGTTVLGIRTLSGSQATMSTVLLGSGSHALHAYYSGDGSYAASTSASVSLPVFADVSLGLKAGGTTYLDSSLSFVTIADFNNDGTQDLAFAGYGGTSVLLGNENGTFHLSGQYAQSFASFISTGDFNGDGSTDLLVTANSSPLTILFGNGNGTFQDPVTVAGIEVPAKTAVGDFNGDGQLDIAVGSSTQALIGILLGDGTGAFQPTTTYSVAATPGALAVADFDGDGIADLAAGSSLSPYVSVLKGNSDGTFQEVQSFNAYLNDVANIAVGDVNNDGKLDIVTAQSSGSLWFGTFLGNGNGTFQAGIYASADVISNFNSIALADLGGDGKPDVLVTSSGTGLAVSTGNGDGSFQPPAFPWPGNAGNVAVGEFNGDSKADVVYPDSYNPSFFVHLGGATPDLSLSIWNPKQFAEGQNGASYTISVMSIGEAPTLGVVTVVASLPPQVTATGISGNGWTCVLATLTCTRSDILLRNLSYPPIKIIVNVANNYTGSTIASATVSGGSDADSTNNQSTNQATVRLPVSVGLTSTPQPSQGGLPVTLTATVSAGTGKVTFYDGVSILGTVNLAGTQAILSTYLAPGRHALRAIYMGDATYVSAISPVRTHTVNPVPSNGMIPGAWVTGTLQGTGDFDGDGNLDVLLAAGQVLFGKGDGNFRPIEGGAAPPYSAIGDFNLDGKLDVFEGNQMALGNGDGSFQTQSTGLFIGPARTVDLNSDGKPDVAGISYAALGNGDGTFQPQFIVPYATDLGDFNNDGDADLVSVMTPNILLGLGNGDSTFPSLASFASALGGVWSANAGDVDSDGNPDVIATRADSPGFSVLLGNGDGTLKAPLQSSFGGVPPVYGVDIGDVDGDGKADIFYSSNPVNMSAPTPVILRFVFGNGSGGFPSSGEVFTGLISNFQERIRFVSGDFNRDGRLDFAVGTGLQTRIILGGQISNLAIAMSHQGALNAGQTKNYQIVITSDFFANTTGAVSVSVSVPVGMSMASLTGQGWTCSAVTMTCSRSDSLASGQSFPPISATLAAAASMPPGTVTPSATLSWNSSQNSASDPTVILSEVPILSINPSPAMQGQPVTLSASYTAGQGKITFRDGVNTIGSATISAGTATLVTNQLLAGLHRISAAYSGDATHAPGSSPVLSLSVAAVRSNNMAPAASPTTGAGPSSIARIDVNGDGKTDLITANSLANTISVLLGNGNGTFQPKVDYMVGTNPQALVAGDLNGDGKPDIAVANAGSNNLSLLLNAGSGVFSPATAVAVTNSPIALATADFNGDGALDFVAAFTNNGAVLLLGHGDATFTAGPNLPSTCCSGPVFAVDMNNDGKPDIVSRAIHLGNGDGTFQLGNYWGTFGPRYSPGDFDTDGNTDLAYVGVNEIVVARSVGGYASTSAPTASVSAIIIADANGDGKPDVVTTNNSSNLATVFFGDGTYFNWSSFTYPTGSDPRSIVAGDFNGDGRTDFAVANYQSNNVTVVLGIASLGLAPRALFRDNLSGPGLGSIRMTTFGSNTVLNLQGTFISDAAAAEAPDGRVFAAGLDQSNALWSNVYNQFWEGWKRGGGIFVGTPEIAATNDGAWVAARAASGSFWLVNFDGTNYGNWIGLGGVFATDPSIAACEDGSLYVIGRDNYNALWSMHFVPGTGAQEFVLGGGVVQGKPSVSCGSDNAAYVIARDNWNSSWIARVAGETWTGWFNGGAVANSDPQIVALGGSMAVVILDGTGAVYRSSFTVGPGNGWQSWIFTGGVLSDLAPAGLNGELYFAGRASDGALWWWRESGNQWTNIGNAGVVGGKLAGTPR